MRFKKFSLNFAIALLALSVVGGLAALSISPEFFNGLLGLSFVWSDGLVWLLCVLLGGLVLKLWIPKYCRISLLAMILLYLSFAAGVVEVLFVLLFLISIWSVGRQLLSFCYSDIENIKNSHSEAVLIGLVVWLAITGAVLSQSINYRFLYIAIIICPILYFFKIFSKNKFEIREKFLTLQDWVNSIPFYAWALGLVVMGWVLRWSSFPSLSFDDHAGHLRLWTELLTYRRAQFDVNSQIWSAAPFASDLLYASLSLMAGADARSAINMMLAIILFLLVVRILYLLRASALVQWLLVVLMASTPMLGNLLLSMQTELMLAVVALAGLRLVIEAEGGWRGQYVLGVLASAALCASIKLPGAVLGATLLAALVVCKWSQRAMPTRKEYQLRWLSLLLLIPLGFVALHSYVLAWVITGNPVFPLYNAVFLSPYFAAENFSDTRWIHGFSLWSYVRAFFHTSEFFEAGDYTAGWQYLLMFPIALVGVFRADVPRGLRLTLFPIIGFGLIMFSATQYWRYLFPVMPIISVFLSVMFFWRSVICRTLAFVLALVCIFLNIFFFPKVSWMMTLPPATAFANEGKSKLVGIYAPVALLNEKINKLAPDSRVLYPSHTPYGATLQGHPLYPNWYSPSLEKLFVSLKNARSMANFLAEKKVNFVILSMNDQKNSEIHEVLLREHLAMFGSVVAQEGPFVLHKLNGAPLNHRVAFDLRASINKEFKGIDVLLPIIDGGVMASVEPQHLAVFKTSNAEQVRYSVNYNCNSESGFFVAQINWDSGDPYYRLVACKNYNASFVEAIPVPTGASYGTIYVTVRDNKSAMVNNLTVELRY